MQNGGNPSIPIPIPIETENPELKIAYFGGPTSLEDLNTFISSGNASLNGTPPDYIYVTIGSKSPTDPKGDDTTNSRYQIIPDFFSNGIVTNVCIILFDIFENVESFIKESAIIKRRYTELSANALPTTVNVSVIMCNLRFPPYTDEYAKMPITSFAKVLRSIRNYAFVVANLQSTRLMICNFIRFKRPNELDTNLFLNTNTIIKWALSGDSKIENNMDVFKKFGVDKSTLENPDIVIDKKGNHYIWGGYGLLNLIYKYEFHDAVVMGLRTITSKDTTNKCAEILKHFTLRSHENDMSCLPKIFSVRSDRTPPNFSVIDITYPYYDNVYPNFYEEKLLLSLPT
jgi:hypothetical protein